MSDGRSVGDPAFIRRAFTEFHRELLEVRAKLTGAAPATLRAGGAPAAAAVRPASPEPGRALPRPGDPLLGDPTAATAGAATAAVRPASPEPGGSAQEVRKIQKRLAAVLDEQKRAARWLTARDRAQLEEAQYVMVALADEILLQTDWPSRRAWRNDLLEMRVFGTHVAGERVFERAEALLRAEREYAQTMAEIYLLAISLGFEGGYRASPERERLDALRAQLLALRGPRLSGRGGGDHIIPQAYAHSVEGDPAVILPRTRLWVTLLAASVVFYAVATTLAWRDVSQPLRTIEQRLHDVVTSVSTPARMP